MSWEALGHDPAPGDPGVALQIAATFSAVCSRAEEITSRLRALDGGSGPEVWRGQAADAFRDKLAKVGPDLIIMATHHRQAADALRDFARSLDDAQFTARRAEADAEQAIGDRRAADARRDAATHDAQAAEGTVVLAEARIAQAKIQAATVGALDPTYQATLLTYQQQVATQREAARAKAADARRRAGAAGSEAAHAQARVEAARRLAAQASAVRDDAARTAAARIHAADAPGYDNRSLFDRAWEGAAQKVREISREIDRITASPEFHSFLNILSDIGDVMGAMAAVLAPFSEIPIIGAVVGGLLLAGAAFKGAALAGTLVAALYGNASWKQVGGRAIDFGLSFVGARGALSAAKLAKPGPVSTLAGQVKRSINYAQPGKVGGLLKNVEPAAPLGKTATRILGKVHIDPQTAFRAKTAYSVFSEGRKLEKSVKSLIDTGQHLSKDIQQYHDPQDQHTLAAEAPRLAKKIAGDHVGKVLGNGVPGKIGTKAAEYDAEHLTKMVIR